MAHPEDVDRHAPIVVELTAVISAPRDVVWDIHSDVSGWPQWQTDIDEASIEGPLAVGETFTWSTFGLTIPSTVYRLEPGALVLWGGVTNGIMGRHLWHFEDIGHETRVSMSESWSGAPVDADTENLRAQLTASLTSWLSALKSEAIRRSTH